MDDVRLGDTLRVLRIRKRLRQSDVARRARIKRQVVGRVEAGLAGHYPLDSIRSIANALGARLETRLRYQGAELDRILSSVHAELHESFAAYLSTLDGWVWLPEVTYSHYGERGVIDILAWHSATRSLLVIELKTELVDPQGLVAVMHRRVRLGREIAAREGWDPLTVNAWVVVRDSSTERRRARRHARLLAGAFPADGRTARAWMVRPSGTLSALSFWSYGASGGRSHTTGHVQRVRSRQTAGNHLP
jgi:transcriptional regulator with XRE-family HTH domain